MEAHTTTQRQFHRLIVNAAPFGGKAWARFKIAKPVPTNQPFPKRGKENPLPHIRLFAQHFQRVAVADFLHRDGDRGALIRLSNGKARQYGQGRRGKQMTTQHGVAPQKGGRYSAGRAVVCGRMRSSRPCGVAR